MYEYLPASTCLRSTYGRPATVPTRRGPAPNPSPDLPASTWAGSDASGRGLGTRVLGVGLASSAAAAPIRQPSESDAAAGPPAHLRVPTYLRYAGHADVYAPCQLLKLVCRLPRPEGVVDPPPLLSLSSPSPLASDERSSTIPPLPQFPNRPLLDLPTKRQTRGRPWTIRLGPPPRSCKSRAQRPGLPLVSTPCATDSIRFMLPRRLASAGPPHHRPSMRPGGGRAPSQSGCLLLSS